MCVCLRVCYVVVVVLFQLNIILKTSISGNNHCYCVLFSLLPQPPMATAGRWCHFEEHFPVHEMVISIQQRYISLARIGVSNWNAEVIYFGLKAHGVIDTGNTVKLAESY